MSDDQVNLGSSKKPTALWRNRSFTLMWTSTAASGFGDRIIQLAAFALLGAGAATADSTAITAGINFWFYVPYVLLGIVAGWVADKLPRKWLMLACDETRAFLLLFAYLLIPAGMVAATIPESEHIKLFSILFLVGTCAAFFNPARNAIIPQIIPLPQLQPANAIIIGIGVIASMVGFLIGGMIIDTENASSVRNALFLAFGLYAISGTFFAFLKVRKKGVSVDGDGELPEASPSEMTQPRRGSGKERGQWGEAWRYLLGHRRIFQLVFLDVVIWSAAIVIYVSVPAVGKINFGLTDNELLFHVSLMSAVVGGGMLAGAILVALRGTRSEAGQMMFWGAVMTGVCTGLLAVMPVYWLAMVLAFGVGVFGNVAIITIVTLLQSITPNYIRGRVMGLVNVVVNTAVVGIYFVVWQLPNADRTMMVALMVLGPVLMVFGGAGLVMMLRSGPMATPGTNVLWRLVRFFAFTWHGLKVEGKHHIPTSGPVLLAANHTTGLDPFLMQAKCRRTVRWLMLEGYLYSFANPLWKRVEPVAMSQGEDGQPLGEMADLRKIISRLQQGEIVGMFPEGALQRDHRDLQEFRDGLGLIARRGGVKGNGKEKKKDEEKSGGGIPEASSSEMTQPRRGGGVVIVPCWISGTPRTKRMLWHFVLPSRCRVRFGPGYVAGAREKDAEIVAEVRRRMLALRDASMS